MSQVARGGAAGIWCVEARDAAEPQCTGHPPPQMIWSECQQCPGSESSHCTACLTEISYVKSQVLSRPTIQAKSMVTAQRRGITHSPVSFSSSSFLLNGSRLLGISIPGVPVFVKRADSYQESGQNSPWEKSSLPETWQAEPFHADCMPSWGLHASDLTPCRALEMAGFGAISSSSHSRPYRVLATISEGFP